MEVKTTISTSAISWMSVLWKNLKILMFPRFMSWRVEIQFIFQKEIDTLDVWFDAKQMQKVINNLISNALKHTKKDGIITIKVRKENNEAVIDVNDTGAGIAPEDIDKIFYHFRFNTVNRNVSVRIHRNVDIRMSHDILQAFRVNMFFRVQAQFQI